MPTADNAMDEIMRDAGGVVVREPRSKQRRPPPDPYWGGTEGLGGGVGTDEVGATYFCCGCCCPSSSPSSAYALAEGSYDADVSEIDTTSYLGSPFPSRSVPPSPAADQLLHSSLLVKPAPEQPLLDAYNPASAFDQHGSAESTAATPQHARPHRRRRTPRWCPRCCYKNCRCCCFCRGRHKARRCCNCFCATSWSVSAVILLLFYVALPLVLTALLNSATIQFNTVHMEHDFRAPLVDGHDSSSSNNDSGTLALFARCRLVGLKSPVDVGIEAQASGLDVYHRGGHLGRLLPHSEVLVHRNSPTGDFELPADLAIVDVARFHAFAHRLLSNDNVTWDLRTRGPGVFIRLRLDFSFWFPHAHWDLFVPGVKFNKTVVMAGCRGFHNTTLEVFTLDDGPPCIPGTPPDEPGLNVHLHAKVFNPSAANVSHMGTVSFDMTYDPDVNRSGYLEGVGSGLSNRRGASEHSVTRSSVLLGTIQSDDSLSVAPGWNQLVAHGRFTAQGASADVLIQRFLNGESTLLSAKAPEINASSDPLFSEFVGGLSISTTLHGPKQGLIKAGALLLTAELIAEILNPFRSKTKPIIVPTQIELRNPFLAVMTISEVSFDVIYENVTVGTAKHSGIDLVIPRNGTVWMPTVDMNVKLYIPGMFDRLVRLVEKMIGRGHAELGVAGNFSFGSGGLRFNPKNYVQLDSVPGCIQTPAGKGKKQEHKPCPPERLEVP